MDLSKPSRCAGRSREFGSVKADTRPGSHPIVPTANCFGHAEDRAVVNPKMGVTALGRKQTGLLIPYSAPK